MPGLLRHHGSTIPCRWVWLVIVLWFGSSGCATLPYRYSQFHQQDDVRAEVVYEYGEPDQFLDSIAWATGIWSRVLSLNSRVNKHELSEETKTKLTAYLDENDLTDVLVRVNQYDPKGEWQRLRQNTRVAPGWRYTAGMLGMARYTLFPGRIFGGDFYNPFTNSLHLNSDVSAVVMHEAAYAKDVHQRAMPGSYAVLNGLPGVSLWRHTVGVNDILSYARSNDDWIVERETYRVVYPQMGVRSVALTGPFVSWWEGLVFGAAGATVGHVTGQAAIARRTKERSVEQAELEVEEASESELILSNRFKVSGSTSRIQLTDHKSSSASDHDENNTSDGDLVEWDTTLD